MADVANPKQMFVHPIVPPLMDGFLKDQKPTGGLDTDRRMQNVDMLDIEALERQRDGDRHAKQEPASATFSVAPAGLTTEQKNLIDEIFTEKTAVFVSDIKQQFNNMHLELIRNFMQQETEVRAVLMKVARQNRMQKQELARLRDENSELRRINF